MAYASKVFTNLGFVPRGSGKQGTWYEAPEGETVDTAKMVLKGIRRMVKGMSLKVKAKGKKVYVFVGEKGADKSVKMEGVMSDLDVLLEYLKAGEKAPTGVSAAHAEKVLEPVVSYWVPRHYKGGWFNTQHYFSALAQYGTYQSNASLHGLKDGGKISDMRVAKLLEVAMYDFHFMNELKKRTGGRRTDQMRRNLVKWIAHTIVKYAGIDPKDASDSGVLA